MSFVSLFNHCRDILVNKHATVNPKAGAHMNMGAFGPSRETPPPPPSPLITLGDLTFHVLPQTVLSWWDRQLREGQLFFI